MRTKPRWVTDPDALRAVLTLRGMKTTDYLMFISPAEWTPPNQHQSDAWRWRRMSDGRWLSREQSAYLEYVHDTYNNDTLTQQGGASHYYGWKLIGWRPNSHDKETT